MFIKDGTDRKVRDAVDSFNLIVQQMPYFFRETKTASSHKEPEFLKKDANGDEWRQALLSTQMDIKSLFIAHGDLRQSFMEVFGKVQEIVKALKEGYDVQGKALVSICRKLDVSFDQLVAMYVEETALQSDEKPKEDVVGNLPFQGEENAN